MKDEIKEILDRLERIDHKEYSGGFEFADSGSFDEDCRCFEERKKLANYITNLQEEKYKVIHTSIVQKKQLTNKLNKLTNKYNDLQKENNSLKQMSKDTYDTSQEIISELTKENERLKDELQRLHNLLNSQAYKDLDNYKSRIDKAVEYIKENSSKIMGDYGIPVTKENDLLNILQGVGKDE